MTKYEPLDEAVNPEAPMADAARDSSTLLRTRRRSALFGVLLLAVTVALAVPLAQSARHPWFQPFDDSWRAWIIGHRFAAGTVIAKALSVAGSSIVTWPVRIGVIVLLSVRRKWTQLAAFITAIVVSEICIGVVKSVIDRPRPLGSLVATTSASFPSGHAIATAVTAFGIVVALVPRGRRRWYWIIAATTLAATMSWSRTYLSAHWATDTIGGTTLGVGIALITESIFEGGRRQAATIATDL